MGIFQTLFGNSMIEQPPSKSVNFFGLINGKSKVLTYEPLKWYKINPFVFTAIHERAKAVSNCRFYIKNEEGELLETDLTRKLNKPNPYLSRNEFVMQLMTYKGIWGTGYLYVNRVRQSESLNTLNFINIPTDQIKFGDELILNSNYDFILKMLERTEDNFIIYYCSLDGYKNKLLEKDNLLPFFDSTIFTNPYFSESRLRSLQYVVSNIQASLESQNTFLSSPGGIGLILPDNKDVNGVSLALRTEEKNEIEKQIQNDYGSLTGQNNLRIVNAPIKYESTIVDVSKLKLTETLTHNALILFGAYGLPKELLTAMMQGSTFENQKTAYKNYIQSTAQVEADSIANSLDVIFPSREGKLVADFSHLPIMQENEKERATVDKTKADAIKIEKEVWDAWLDSGYVNEAQYKEHFNL